MRGSAVDAGPLSYASGRIQITLEGDRLVIDIPPTESAPEFWLRVSFTLGTSLVCLLGVIWPGGITVTGGGIVMESGPILVRVVSLLIAVGLAALCWAWFRNRHAHSTLTLRGRSLQYNRAGTWGMISREYDLSKYVDVGLEQDDDGTHLAFLRGDGSATVVAVGGRASRAGQAELAAAAAALRQAAWPRRAAEYPRSIFTRVDADTLESDRGFVVRTPQLGVVEYREGPDVLTLHVERAWAPDHAMCFVVPATAIRKWDAGDIELPPEKRREIEFNLTEALGEWGVRLLTNSSAT
jgi:hypothetical protein